MRFLYSTLFRLLLPFVMLRLVWRSRRAPAYRRRLGERLGYFTPPADPRPVIWIHAVSLGETLAARPLIERLLAERSDHQLVITTTTPTGSEQVLRLFGERVFHVYAPWDTPGAVRRFLRRVQPRMLVLMETELWPNMLHLSRKQDVRIVLANARLSVRSAAGYARIPKTTRGMFACLDWVGAQASTDADHFLQLGMLPSQIGVIGSIKFDVSLDDTLRERAAALRRDWSLDHRPVFIVASTHEGEDEIALDALAMLQERFDNVLMLLAPRHPERFAEVAALIASRGLTMAHRADGGVPQAGTQVLLIDTLGELLQLFGVADVAVIGGSFVTRGGHNPLEAAAWGLPVLCGQSMFNFEDVTQRLQAAGALEQVLSTRELAAGLTGLLGDPEEAQRRGAAARRVLEANRGSVDRLMAGLDSLLGRA